MHEQATALCRYRRFVDVRRRVRTPHRKKRKRRRRRPQQSTQHDHENDRFQCSKSLNGLQPSPSGLNEKSQCNPLPDPEDSRLKALPLRQAKLHQSKKKSSSHRNLITLQLRQRRRRKSGSKSQLKSQSYALLKLSVKLPPSFSISLRTLARAPRTIVHHHQRF